MRTDDASGEIEVVYCKDNKRTQTYRDVDFTFLGFTFCPRRAQSRQGKLYTSFLPGVSENALKQMRMAVREWRLSRYTSMTLTELARQCNPILRGWLDYYGAFYQEALGGFCWYMDQRLSRWARRKHKRLQGRKQCRGEWLRKIKMAHSGGGGAGNLAFRPKR
ncbi:group II intron maturase-specific domain-containing protein [Dyella sp. M7H15-1]|uniref:group II intron maturase-specific domain-containing protein n=1 Tax=Dyella sp. M7H15-1 TaxID=2501295 RepID=UPI001F0CB898|nr:group II intron maturase-specific domain-containing protein [Dyella sp. M7H15-1]